MKLLKPFKLDPSDDFPVAVGEDEAEVDFEDEVEATELPAFVALVADPDPDVVVAPATATVERVAGGVAVLACDSYFEPSVSISAKTHPISDCGKLIELTVAA
jgi:hypothetical protein